MIKIYILKHPITEEIRYIGYTKTSLKERLKLHLKKAKIKNNHRSNWIKSLPTSPIIQEIDEGFYEDRNWMEQMYISLFKSWGFNLVNGTVGGDGGDTFSGLSDEAKQRMIEKCRAAGSKPKGPFTQEHKDKLKANHAISNRRIKHPSLGIKHSNKSKSLMREAKLGKPSSRKGKSNYGKIKQLDLDGNVLNIFDNPALAGEFIGQNNTNIIRAATGKQKTAYGFMWQFM